MRIADGEAALFSVKCFAAAMLAYWIALRIGLTRPYWAVTTSYIVAQPLAGAVLSKAVYRLIGTALGATAAVALVPTFVNEPAVLSFALALWLGLCLYVSLLDRTPRAYIFLLAGYTASIIGFPSVEAPGTIFTTAILRVQEITIGILCGSLIHGVLFPRTVADRLLARIEAILTDGERWSRDALSGARDATLDRERRRLAIDISDLHQLSTHLPFDTARFLPRVRSVRALQDQISLLLPLASVVEDRLAELKANCGGLPAEVEALVARTSAWLAGPVQEQDRAEIAGALIAEARALEPKIEQGWVWRDMLLLNLLSRLAELIATHRDARLLGDQIRAPTARAVTPEVSDLLANTRGRTLHRDRWLAVRAAFGTIATILLGSAFWIGAAWPDGAGAVLIAGVCCALFGSADDPGGAIWTFLVGSTIGIAVAAVYAYAILPRVTDFVTLAAVLAPPMLLLGSMLARPPLTLITLGTLLGFLNSVGLNNAYDANFSSFINSSLSQILGTAFAVVTVGLFQTVGADQAAARLLRAGFRDVARRAEGAASDTARWASRMLDRVGLLAPRVKAAEADPGKPLLDALNDLRTGVVAGDLRKLGEAATAEERALIETSLADLGDHYRRLDPLAPRPPDPRLLADIDRAVDAFARDPEPERRRQGLVLLTSLRRNLFPRAPSYAGGAA